MFAAFCLTVGLDDCEVCGSRERCGVSSIDDTPICNCYSDCYEHGDCCTDVSHVENCLGMYTYIFAAIKTGCLLISSCVVCVCVHVCERCDFLSMVKMTLVAHSHYEYYV